MMTDSREVSGSLSTMLRSRAARYFAYSGRSTFTVLQRFHQPVVSIWSVTTGWGTRRSPGIAWANSAIVRGMW